MPAWARAGACVARRAVGRACATVMTGAGLTTAATAGARVGAGAVARGAVRPLHATAATRTRNPRSRGIKRSGGSPLMEVSLPVGITKAGQRSLKLQAPHQVRQGEWAGRGRRTRDQVWLR